MFVGSEPTTWNMSPEVTSIAGFHDDFVEIGVGLK